MGEEGKVCKILVEEPLAKKPLGRQKWDGRMGSEWILGRLAEGCSEFNCFRIGAGGGLI
jgi:hypothetical protein